MRGGSLIACLSAERHQTALSLDISTWHMHAFLKSPPPQPPPPLPPSDSYLGVQESNQSMPVGWGRVDEWAQDGGMSLQTVFQSGVEWWGGQSKHNETVTPSPTTNTPPPTHTSCKKLFASELSHFPFFILNLHNASSCGTGGKCQRVFFREVGATSGTMLFFFYSHALLLFSRLRTVLFTHLGLHLENGKHRKDTLPLRQREAMMPTLGGGWEGEGGGSPEQFLLHVQ